MGGVDGCRWGEAVFVEMQISGSRLGIDGKGGGVVAWRPSQRSLK